MGQGEGVAAVVMAAGAGRRMGYFPKSLLERDGEPLLLRQIRLLGEAGVEHIVVVLGHHAQALQAVLSQARVPAPVSLHWVVNAVPDEGPGASLRCGLAALPADVGQLLVQLADQPLLELPDVQAVLGHSSLISTLRYAEYADGSAAFRAARAIDASRGHRTPGPAGR